ncbi:MAG: O-antigen ligase family protein [Thermoanaerobaculia bacterium]
MPLSLEASASRRTAVWCVALFSAFVAAGLAGRHRIHRRWLMVALLTAGLFEVLYGGKLWIERATTLWGAGIPGGEGRLRGTFVNSNHLALYLNLALAATFAWLWWSYRRSQRMLDWDRRVLVIAPPLIVWLTLFLGLAFTKSRAGLLSALLGTLVQALLVPTRTPLEPSSGPLGRLTYGKPRRKRLLVGGGLGLVGLAVVAAIGSQEAASRWQLPSLQGIESNRRLQVYSKTLGLWSQFPLTGTGLGSFRDGFPLVQPPGLVEEWHHAHNDWLELLATTGIIGTGLFLAGLGMLLRRLARVLADGRRTEDRAAALAALGAMAAVGVHSFFDFGLTMPATAFTLVVLLGSAAGARLRH